MPLPPRFDAPPYGSLNPRGPRANGTTPFTDRNSDRPVLQPRGKTARELTIGRKLRELREERLLTQQDMAGKAGVPRTHISPL